MQVEGGGEGKDAAKVSSAPKYWSGYWWNIKASKEENGNLGVYIIPAVAHRGSSLRCGEPTALSCCMEVRSS